MTRRKQSREKEGAIVRDIYIVGAGGFGREVQWLIERINAQQSTWNFCGYVDDGRIGRVNDYPIVGSVESFVHMCESGSRKVDAVCAIGNSKVRKSVVERLRASDTISFPNLIDPSVILSERVTMGDGNIICAGNILTVDIRMGNYNIVNLDCTVGHDVVMQDFVTVYPSANISGATTLECCIEIGTGAQLIQGLSVHADSIIGAGAVVVNNITEAGTYAGVPARKLQ